MKPAYFRLVCCFLAVTSATAFLIGLLYPWFRGIPMGFTWTTISIVTLSTLIACYLGCQFGFSAKHALSSEKPAEAFPHRLFSRKPIAIAVTGAIVLALIFQRMLWDTLHPQVIYDMDTGFYAQFARNLVRYPLSVTHGLMSDLVGNGSYLTAGQPVQFYLDHPSGFVWLIALLNRYVVSDAFIATRIVSIVSAIGLIVLTLAFLYRRVSTLAVFAAAMVAVTIPLFWEYSLVGNFTMPAAFFIAATGIAFLAYLRNPTLGRLLATSALWSAGMLCDWPAYLLGAPIALTLAMRRQWPVLVYFTILGVAVMVFVFWQMTLAAPGFSVANFFRDTLSPLIGTREPGHRPLILGVAMAATLGIRAFAVWSFFLLLPLATFIQKSVDRSTFEIRWLFLATLCVGVLNDVLFYNWSATHYFWSYYLIPTVIVGAAMTVEWAFGQGRLARAPKLALLSLFVLGLIANSLQTLSLTRGYFTRPMSLPQYLAANGVPGLLDADAALVIDPQCRRDQPPEAQPSNTGGKESRLYPNCSPYWHYGFGTRYFFDKPLVLANEFNGKPETCRSAYFIFKGSNIPERLAEMRVQAAELQSFKWYVVPIAKLPQRYCEFPSEFFKELYR